MHDRVSVHSICFPTAGIEELFECWRILGARRVSFNSGQVLEAGPANMRAMLGAGGHHAETVTHIFRRGPLAARDVEADRAGLMEAIVAAAAIGAKSIYMLTGGRGDMDWEAAADAFAAAIAPCRAAARDAGVKLAIENTTPLYADAHLANNLRDTI
ncbi:MAG TPA: hypothetical protein VMB71_07295, partial [Acetobacteraceae bacterium]|nr:hypothetical protein [Acetobacteraceae bacterium]